MKISLLGAGAWGTALAVQAAPRHDVVLWARRPEIAEAVRDRHENPDYLPGVTLPAGLSATTDARLAVAGADFVVLAVPSLCWGSASAVAGDVCSAVGDCVESSTSGDSTSLVVLLLCKALAQVTDGDAVWTSHTRFENFLC